MLVLADGSVLIEWPAVPGAHYLVEYSADMAAWHAGGPAIVSGGNRVQWIDKGAPKRWNIRQRAGRAIIAC